ncbi:conserved exported hypothetical protein [Candidatus Terasakiella magnetica]|uniref:DUF3035 domain-containing protein n=1 Tax=Candidatus Terasakiella magnetica TaxID=1867952 RepID=A0A1C3RIH0_9PROT|nr:DUF3035 domain-containing protein [Candidatus Terasakiella magnetica]SCA57070.1 conserved exported hypothetical protein [Candidatus Terasakiella magnetica]
MSVRTYKKFLGLAIAAVALSACSGTKEMLGLEKTAPDEFAVYTRAPLSLPPDYALKPPTPGVERPNTENQQEKARRALTGRRAAAAKVDALGSYSNMSPGLKSLLEQTGAVHADPSIRQTIDRETSAFISESETFAKDLMFWKNKEPFGSKIDAAQEAQRIREAQALGQAVDGQSAVVIERKEGAILEGALDFLK